MRIRVFCCLRRLSVTASTAEAHRTDANVRVFAIGNKQRVANGVSYQAYADTVSALMDKEPESREQRRLFHAEP